MIKYLLQGLLFGLAYVAPIGTQNLYVINTAMQKSKAETYKVALITILFDISLAISCFFGIGALIQKYYLLKLAILLFGFIVIIYIGAGLIRSSSQILEDKKLGNNSLIKIAISCFAVTWLNPQAIIDGSLLLGGFNASLPAEMSKYFILGVCIASAIWFSGLAGFVGKFRSKFNKIIRGINIICGLILIFYGLKLGYSFIESIYL
ncbi:LysE/ArgO family amino acid transporter [Clostridium beijerinckii]|uniref:LysE/ArgO family amino acid transporter n=1 Tax=Clostridium beijerinckii TaxID=1520 RepID=UPI00098CBB74|nr:LysE family transporter [Clostridium beijerinckii]MBA8935306.1 L-lysine exporter family protein LysE/ArgO [Clostridium beijerinckii]NRT34589.1 L-lysine exporter family protein LysE/ArgO [Clostridium beijerinckii]NRT45980.1 L-lysine exporter family protein LysE/ArgO [Clostridium beijerinckii]NRU39702.1 L-lysine exporter family protein LysE/ArgO [Clostridium beijerinckii]NRZ20018.1 L-lysine exporter family protein LysE/ArgO [Clostridium beijerinckii]